MWSNGFKIAPSYSSQLCGSQVWMVVTQFILRIRTGLKSRHWLGWMLHRYSFPSSFSFGEIVYLFVRLQCHHLSWLSLWTDSSSRVSSSDTKSCSFKISHRVLFLKLFVIPVCSALPFATHGDALLRHFNISFKRIQFSTVEPWWTLKKTEMCAMEEDRKSKHCR